MKGWGKVVAFAFLFLVYAGFALYRLVRDIMQHGLTGANISGVAVFVFLPLLIWALAVGTKRFNRSHMARTRAAFPGLLVLPAGWASFMVPPLRSWPNKPVEPRGYLAFLLVAHEQHLAVHRQRFRKGYVLAGQLPWGSVRSVGDVPSKGAADKPGTKVLALDLDSQGTDLPDRLELYLCADDASILAGAEFDEAKRQLERVRSAALR
ncbi:hypothetical protein [Sinomonas susongensis]|uniref:hypothetical protein n=1 Tax=Sinomonas susongensis TaxID=1324851 RepID=UPI001108146D|nr:hypothetical protein [Sinomonas susongensis]